MWCLTEGYWLIFFPKSPQFTKIPSMKSYEMNLTQGSLFKNIFIYSVPLIFSNLLQVLFNIADVAVVGRFAGALPLGSVGSTSQLLFLYTGLIMGLGGGINVIVAFYIGAKNKKDLNDSLTASLFVSILTGVILMILGLVTARPILSAIKTKPELLQGAVTYFSIYMLGLPGCALYNFGNAVLSAAGDTKRPLYYLTAAGIVNIILNLFFVIVCRMDCAGVAIASVISQYVSAVLVLNAVCRGIGDVKLDFAKLKRAKLNRTITIRILKIGIPSGLQNAIFAVANTFVQMGINSFDAIMVAGTAAASNLDPIVYNCMGAFYTACASFIGQNYGAKNKKRIRDSYLVCSVYSFSFGLVIGLLLKYFGRPCLSLFTTDNSVIEAGMLRMNIMGFSFCVASLMDNTIAASRGLGKTLIPSIFVMIGSCVFRIAWIYTIFAWFQTIPSLFLLYIFSWFITAVAEIIYFVWCFNHDTELARI